MTWFALATAEIIDLYKPYAAELLQSRRDRFLSQHPLCLWSQVRRLLRALWMAGNFVSPAVNVVGLATRRTTQSRADLLLVFVTLREVRTFATVRTTMKNGYNLEQQNMGVVNAQTPTAAQAKAIAS